VNKGGSGVSSDELPQKTEADGRITLGLLDAVEEGEHSQRSLAASLGIALGLTNAYLKRCVRMGLVKVRQVPANRYAYFLTPQGFAEKSRLTAQFLARSFRFYRQSREEISEIFARAAASGQKRVLLAGPGELAEIALICAMEHDLEIVGVLDPGSNLPKFMNVPRRQSLDGFAYDAVLVTDLKRAQEVHDDLAGKVEPGRLLTPKLLRVATKRNGDGNGAAS
jgi:DNA-binding MarR family transcriptional regulator